MASKGKDEYNPQKIEPKWQEKWRKEGLYSTPKKPRDKKYILDMFPYPSGATMHVGHLEGYVGTDVVARYERMKGSSVLHPMGWDAFGLPAENYAIKTGIHPYESTRKNIETFKRQLNSTGLSYDWAHEINTSDPSYYKWNQWLFILMFKQGLAYKKKSAANWCPSCETVLANEQVLPAGRQGVAGECERCGTRVVQKEIDQWFLKITDFADRLISGLDKIDWPREVKVQQINWIGRSEGAEIQFKVNTTLRVQNEKLKINTFTTRPDTLFGATFMVLSPDSDWVKKVTTKEQKQKVAKYIKEYKSKSDLGRNKSDLKGRAKNGVFTGSYAVNPATGEEIPIWVADYVVAGYGSGAIMAVPAHDERDYEFAKRHNLPIREVVVGSHLPFIDYGLLTNSGEFSDLRSEEAIPQIIKWLEKKKIGRRSVSYHLHDWGISRQRYWGTPIPMIYCEKCGWQPVAEADLPVLLPKDVDFKPTGKSPLARSKSFQKGVVCPNCNGVAKREVDTMDTYFDSSWYFIRFVDNQNSKEFAGRKSMRDWLPVDLYVGGGHVVQHLLFARFFWKVLVDAGLIPKSLGEEPFLKLRAPGWILGADSRKMSKRWNNVVTPDEIIPKYGADTLRMYEMFMGPFEAGKPWSQEGIEGANRFLRRVWRLVNQAQNQNLKIKMQNDNAKSKNLERAMHKTIKKVTEDIENLRFNTAVAALMEFVNELQSASSGDNAPASPHPMWNPKNTSDVYVPLRTLVLLLAPFAPHMSEELWQRFRMWEVRGGKLDREVGSEKSHISPQGPASHFQPHTSIHLQPWPKYDPKLIKEAQVEVVVQVNGRLRATVSLPRDEADNQQTVETAAKKASGAARHLKGKKVKKVIFVPGRLINFVT